MYKRRIKIFLAVIGLSILVILGRLCYLQFVQAGQCRAEIDHSMRHVEILPTQRGMLVDRNGAILALDTTTYDYCLDYPMLLPDDSPIYKRWARHQVDRISKARGLSPADARLELARLEQNTWDLAGQFEPADGAQGVRQTVAAIVDRVEQRRQALAARELTPIEAQQSHPIVRGLSEEQKIELELGMKDTVGATIVTSHKRYYPRGQDACHVIGLLGEANADDMAKLNLADDQDQLAALRRNYRDGDLLGKCGAEWAFEGLLRGRRGYCERSRLSDEITTQVPAQLGQDVRLTLDIDLQKAAAKLLQDASLGTNETLNGALVVLSVPKGEILAMVSLPTFDLNNYAHDYASLQNDEINQINTPLLNRATMGLYPPGSTAKPITVLAGLHSGKFAIDTGVECRGYLWEPGVLTCFHKTAHSAGFGPITAVSALRFSCNVYCGTVGLRVGLPGMIEMFHAFGYDEPAGCGIGEVAGRLPTLDSEHRQAAYMAIGQSTVAVTPLHVANAMATIARDGEFLSPTLQIDPDERLRTRRTLPLRPEHLAAVREGMFQVVNAVGGSGYHAFHDADVPRLGFSICGKTGTAQCAPQVVHIRGENPHDFKREQRDMGWFAGFAPSDNPQVAFAILLEYVPEGETGGRIAGPVARNLMQLCKDMGYIK